MITSIVLNPAIDVRYSLDHFQLNKSHRCSNYEKTAGGKGLNVARVLRLLGHEVQTTGFLGGSSGEFIAGELKRLMIDNRFIRINEETRTCIAILSEDLTQTEILEAGPYIMEEYIAQLFNVYQQLLDDASVISASGSLPKGLGEDFYSQLIQEANKKNVKFILDSSGMALKKAIDVKPFLIKPNCTELEELCGQELKSEKDIIQQAHYIHRAGVENVVVSLGAEGAILVNGSGAYKAKIPQVQAVNPVGSGDSMLAGLIHSVTENFNGQDALRYACACGISNAMEAETGKINSNAVHEIMERISVVGVDL